MVEGCALYCKWIYIIIELFRFIFNFRYINITMGRKKDVKLLFMKTQCWKRSSQKNREINWKNWQDNNKKKYGFNNVSKATYGKLNGAVYPCAIWNRRDEFKLHASLPCSLSHEFYWERHESIFSNMTQVGIKYQGRLGTLALVVGCGVEEILVI